MILRKNTAKDLWQPRRRIELTYKRTLKRILKRMNTVLLDLNTTDEIVRALKKYVDTPEFKNTLKVVQ